jgi:hypothetical protein
MTILTGGLLFLCAIAVLLPACTASIDISMARNDLRANFLPFPASARASDPLLTGKGRQQAGNRR